MNLTTVPSTELEAVNFMLGTIGEMPVDTIEDSELADVTMAINILSFQNRQTQAIGWHWNTEERMELTPEASGEILLPSNTLKADINDPAFPELDLVLRGQRFYDRANHTYEIAETIKADLVVLLPFTDLPQPARDFITIRSARSFQAQVVGSQVLDALTDDDERTAWLALWQAEDEAADHNMLTDNPRIRMDIIR